jgi:hypothetical protein
MCMNNRLLRFLLLIIVFAGTSRISPAQIILRGMVVDSSSMHGLADVNILIKQTDRGTVSDYRGGFLLKTGENDTIVFSKVGYFSKTLPAVDVNKVVIIFLKEEVRMLRPVQVNDKEMPSWLPKVQAESAWKNSTYDKEFTDVPGFQGVQTFGPGYVFKMPGSGFKKEAKAKQKLKEVREENDKARNYIQFVNDPEFKAKIMSDYQLTEEDYYQLLARFNEKNKDFLYRLDLREVIPLLVQFYADNAGEMN